MRKFLGNFGGLAATLSVLHAVPLLLLLSATLGHTQDCTLTPTQANQMFQFTNLYPTSWPIGQSTTVTLTGSWTTPPTPLGCEADAAEVFGTVAYGVNGCNKTWCTSEVLDPNVTVPPTSIIQSLNPVQTTFTVTVSPNASYAEDFYTFDCMDGPLSTGGSCPNYSGIDGFITLCPVYPPAISSVSPSTWPAGPETTVTITGANFVTYAAAQATPGCPWTQVGITPNTGTVSYTATVNSASTITVVLAPAASDPAGTANISVGTVIYNINPPSGPVIVPPLANATAQIIPDPCPLPTISSVSPNVWFAGQSYNSVIIKGRNFTTAAKATKTCPATTVSVTAPSGATVALGAATVNSATQITIASVTPPATETTEGATVAVSGEGIAQPNADVLEIPSITWTTDPDGSNPLIAGPYATLPNPSAVVGQQILLTTTPTATTLAGLPIQVTLAPAAPPAVPNPWTVGTTPANIGGYTVIPPTAAAPTVSSATVTPTVLTNPGTTALPMTVYWISQGSATATYQYCVTLTSGSTLCNPSSTTAIFNVTGPTGGTMSFTPYSPSVSIADLDTCISSSGITYPGGPWLFYAQGVTGPACTGDQTSAEPGITFNSPTGYQNASGGNFLLVQLKGSDVVTGGCCTSGAGLDSPYPYAGPPSNDGPGMYIPSTVTSASRTFIANMFLMWQSSTANSIPVPLGYQNWGFSGTATCSTSCETASNWTVTTNGTPGPIGGFVTSSPSQTQTNDGNNILVDGYPTWTTVSP